MNFFEQQALAQRQTRILIFLFVLAVVAIVVAVNAALALIWIGAGSMHFAITRVQTYPNGFFLTNTVVTLGFIVGGTLLETFNLRNGGEAVAKMAGGRLVAPASSALTERRLLNAVEEMALAASIACPSVYVLDQEKSINAFAAGYNPNEAVIAVTRGALERLTRDELQGVIAHEFSHILNGDMRMNVRLIGVLFGIQMIASFGQHLMDFGSRSWRVRSRDDKGPSAQWIILATGVALFAIGYIGIFFGRLIKSAVSRQREFLADASAVQFTRNPHGIGDALRKIGGLSRQEASLARIQHPNAEQLSHLFLTAIKPGLLAGVFATHPPIEERLRRIFGKPMTLLAAPEVQDHGEAVESERLPDIAYVASDATSSLAESMPAVTPPPGLGRSVFMSIPPELDQAARAPHSACALVYALLLEPTAGRAAQMAILNTHLPQQSAFIAHLADAVVRLPKSARLSLLDLAMPALKQLAPAERTSLLARVDQLILADQRLTLAEFVLQTILMRRLSPDAARATPIAFANVSALKPECTLLLSLVAQISAATQNAPTATAFMRGATCYPMLNLSPTDLLDATTIGFNQVRLALNRANQLAPLAKPALIKALLATAGNVTPMPVATADLLRAICAAIEAPIPPVVAATYVIHTHALDGERY